MLVSGEVRPHTDHGVEQLVVICGSCRKTPGSGDWDKGAKQTDTQTLLLTLLSPLRTPAQMPSLFRVLRSAFPVSQERLFADIPSVKCPWVDTSHMHREFFMIVANMLLYPEHNT